MVSSRPRGEPIRLIPPPTQPLLVVQISGAVAKPGVYSLPPGSRVLDTIQAAGGLLPDADATLINQAALIQDGQMIWVPAHSSSPQNPPTPDSAPAVPVLPDNTSRTSPTLEVVYPINLNTATPEELESLPGIGPELAARIIEYRNTHGPFAQTEDIVLVNGIGPKTFEKIKDLITVAAPGSNQTP